MAASTNGTTVQKSQVSSSGYLYPMASGSDSFNFPSIAPTTGYEISTPYLVVANGNSNDVSIGGTFSESYDLEFVNANTGQQSYYQQPGGTYEALNNQFTVPQGTYYVYLQNNVGGTLSAQGSMYWNG